MKLSCQPYFFRSDKASMNGTKIKIKKTTTNMGCVSAALVVYGRVGLLQNPRSTKIPPQTKLDLRFRSQTNSNIIIRSSKLYSLFVPIVIDAESYRAGVRKVKIPQGSFHTVTKSTVIKPKLLKKPKMKVVHTMKVEGNNFVILSVDANLLL